MNLAFLDIDGVLNHELFYRGMSRSKRAKDRPLSEIDRESVLILNGLIKETDVKVVISSTWRKSHTNKQIQGYLDYHGFIGEVIGSTPNFEDNNSVRGNEILRWIKDNEKLIGVPYYDYINFVIIDDDSDMLLWQRNNFVHVDGYCGVTPNQMYRAVRFLKGQATSVGE